MAPSGARAREVLKGLVGALDLCRGCEERNLGDGEDAATAKHDFDIEYDESTVSKVRFTDCDLQNVRVENCTWKNVTFTDCKFSSTTFEGVKLENAHFHNVDFLKVTFDKIEFKDVRWIGEYLEKAFVLPQHLPDHSDWYGRFQSSYISRPGSLPIYVLNSSPSSKTAGGFNPRLGRLEKYKNDLIPGTGLTQIELAVSPHSRRGLLEFLSGEEQDGFLDYSSRNELYVVSISFPGC